MQASLHIFPDRPYAVDVHIQSPDCTVFTVGANTTPGTEINVASLADECATFFLHGKTSDQIEVLDDLLDEINATRTKILRDARAEEEDGEYPLRNA